MSMNINDYNKGLCILIFFNSGDRIMVAVYDSFKYGIIGPSSIC